MKCCDFPKLAKDQVVLRSQTLVTDSYGGQTLTWATAATVWAWVRPITVFSSAERFAQNQLQAMASHKIVIRYNSTFKDIKSFATYSMTFDSRTFSIVSIKNFDKALKNYGTDFQEILVNDNGPELVNG